VSAVTGLPHSQVIAILLPHVVEANLHYAIEKYGTVATALGVEVEGLSPREAATCVVTELRHFQAVGKLPTRFRDCGVSEHHLRDALAIALRWQMHITTNPRPVNKEMLQSILDAAY
jgi:alcohol dehydrogenase class IV